MRRVGVQVKTIEQLIAEANSKGLWLANLFQLSTMGGTTTQPSSPTGKWQANFHHATGWYEYGHGDSAIAALENCLERSKGAKMPAPVQAAVTDPFS